MVNTTIHIGNRVKWLVENKYNGTKEDFAKKVGYKQYTTLFKLFNQEVLGGKVLNKVCSELKINPSELLKENFHNNDFNLSKDTSKELDYKNKVFQLEETLKLKEARIKELEGDIQQLEGDIQQKNDWINRLINPIPISSKKRKGVKH